MNKMSLRKTVIATAAWMALGTGAAHAAGANPVLGAMNSLTGNGSALSMGSNSTTSLLADYADAFQGLAPSGDSAVPGAGALIGALDSLPGLDSAKGDGGPLFTTDSIGLNKSTDAKLAGIDLSPTFTVANGDKLMTMANDNGKGKVTLDTDDDGKVSVGVDAKYKGGDKLTGPVSYDYDVGYTTP